ncbi:MAG: hypothetical protein A2X30_07225 [Elusimicrobia bacterium GWB2_63_16]|nr:MAG: hypothetical protein A2X30_07225 [Elusimicrobia bacterium GWB2_63_16]
MTAAAQEQEPPKEETAAPAKPAAKKKAKKKKKAAPVSEYKFGAVDKPSAYKFDREAEPITKESAKKAAAERAAAAKKKKKKAAAKKAVSEYKFDAVDSVSTYKMDKYADPIVKTPKKKKAAAKKKPAEPAEPAPGHDASGAIPEVN